jgi:hypothetical protein
MPNSGRSQCVWQVRRRLLAFELALMLLSVFAYQSTVAAPKTDVVILRNGDHLTGEVKELSHGQLRFKTDTMFTVMIKWEEIESLQSNQYLEVELSNGLKYFGKAPEVVGQDVLTLQAGEDIDPWKLQLEQVVRIAPIEQGEIYERIKGNVSAGYSYTKASGVTQFNFAGGLKLRSKKRQWTLDGATTLTQQKNYPSSERYNVTGGLRNFLPEKKFLAAWITAESNDELGLQLRNTLGGGYGSFLLQTSLHELAWLIGTNYSRENFTGQPEQDSLEGVLGLSYNLFRFSPLSADLGATLIVYPSVTESGRVRSEGNLYSRYEIIKDLYWEISVYVSADSDPGETAQSKSDYGIVTSLGFTF